MDKEDQLLRKKSLPPELANEERIPEALEALQNAFSDPDVRALIAHREKLLASEARRFEIVCEEERKNSFDETIKGVLKEMKAQGIDRSFINAVRKKAKLKVNR